MDLNAALAVLAADPAAPLDVAELALHLSRDEYPDLDVDAYLAELAGMAHEARSYLRGDLEARVSGLCWYLFHEMGLRGNAKDYYDPRNSYLNQVLDRRIGIPITLSIVTLAVAARAGLPVAGVGLPGHFIVKATADGREVLFDPFHGGRRLTPTDCAHLVLQVTGRSLTLTPEHLRAEPAGRVLFRLLGNLRAIYLRQADYARAVRVLERMRQLAAHDRTLRRDLGICLVQLGRMGPAISHLSAYLVSAAPGEETEAVRQALTQARVAVSRWN